MNQKELKALRDQFEEHYRLALETFIDTHRICVIGDVIEDVYGNHHRVTRIAVSHRLEFHHPWLYQTEYAHATDLIEYYGIRSKPCGGNKGRRPYEAPIQPKLVVKRACQSLGDNLSESQRDAIHSESRYSTDPETKNPAQQSLTRGFSLVSG